MRICIPTKDDRGMNAELFEHFGTATFFTVVDTHGDDVKVLRNPQCHDHQGSCHHIDLLKAHAIDAVVCHGIGRRAHSALTDAGISVLAPDVSTVDRAVDAIRTGDTAPLPLERACGGGRRHGHGHGHGHGGCGGHGHGHGQSQGQGQGQGRGPGHGRGRGRGHRVG